MLFPCPLYICQWFLFKSFGSLFILLIFFPLLWRSFEIPCICQFCEICCFWSPFDEVLACSFKSVLCFHLAVSEFHVLHDHAWPVLNWFLSGVKRCGSSHSSKCGHLFFLAPLWILLNLKECIYQYFPLHFRLLPSCLPRILSYVHSKSILALHLYWHPCLILLLRCETYVWLIVLPVCTEFLHTTSWRYNAFLIGSFCTCWMC